MKSSEISQFSEFSMNSSNLDPRQTKDQKIKKRKKSSSIYFLIIIAFFCCLEMIFSISQVFHYFGFLLSISYLLTNILTQRYFQKKHLYNKKIFSGKTQRILFRNVNFYCLVFITLLLIINVFLFLSKPITIDWNQTFPEYCPEFSENGCTRVANVYSHRTGDIMDKYPLKFQQSNENLSKLINECLQGHGVNREQSKNLIFSHYRFRTLIWGFIDDMAIQIVDCPQENMKSIYVQSQLRIGKSDLGVNLSRVEKLFKCLNSKQKQHQEIGSIC